MGNGVWAKQTTLNLILCTLSRPYRVEVTLSYSSAGTRLVKLGKNTVEKRTNHVKRGNTKMGYTPAFSIQTRGHGKHVRRRCPRVPQPVAMKI